MRKHLYLTYAAALVLGLPASVSATPEDDELLEMSLKDLLTMDVVSSASKYEQKVSEAPASVSVVSAADIQRYGYRTLGELLASLQGIYFISDNTYGYVGVRGFSRPGDYGTRIAVLIDGHRVNENTYGSIQVAGGFTLDMDMIDRVEVVRGSSSSLYGQGAFFGVINVITKNGKDHAGTNISAEKDIDPNRTYVHASYGKRFANGMELFVAASRRDRPGENVYVREFDNPPLSDGISHQRNTQNQNRLFTKLKIKDLTITGSYLMREAGMTVGFDSIFDSPSSNEDHRSYLDILYHHAFSDTLETNLRLSYNYYNYKTALHYDYYGDGTTTINHWHNPTYWLNGEWQWQWRADKHRVVGGVEYQHSLSQKQINFDEDPYYEWANIETDDGYWAVYAQDEFAVTEKLTLNAGIRYDHYDSFGGTVNPRIAAIYRPDDKRSWKLLLGKAFRAPNVYEQYYEDGYFLKRNPAGIQPETVQSYELVHDHRFDPSMRGTASLFYSRVKDMLETRSDTEDDMPFYDNVGSANAYGLELSLDKRWGTGLDAKFSYTWQEAENGDTGERLSASPRHMLKLHLSKAVHENWRAGLRFTYVDSMSAHVAPHDTIGSYLLADFSLTGTPVKNLDLGLHVYNLLDEAFYYPLPDGYSGLDRIQGEQRSVRLNLNYHF